MYHNKITKILQIPKHTYNNGDDQKWEQYQNECNYGFPPDYKYLLNLYGTGGINNFLWILTPFEGNEEINILKRAKTMRVSLNYMKTMFPGKYNYSIFPDEGGLLPWGYTDNGDELYYKDGSIVVFGSRYSDFYEYRMGVVEFIYKLLMREIICDAFPDDFIIGTPEYNSIKL